MILIDTSAWVEFLCRRGGETVRKLVDCLIASVAIRANTPLLHSDTDFDVLARHAALQVDQPRPS